MTSDDDPRSTSERFFFGMWPAPLAACITVVIVVVIAMIMGRADGRDLDGRYANSPLKEWFDHLASGKGLCCSFADGHAVEDPDWTIENAHYRVRVDGEWMIVPDEAVITEPNRAGKTMVWPYYADGKVLYIRCFLPGSMT